MKYTENFKTFYTHVYQNMGIDNSNFIEYIYFDVTEIREELFERIERSCVLVLTNAEEGI